MPVHLYDVPKSVTPFKDKGIKTAINGKSVFEPLLPPVVVCKIFKWGYSIYILFYLRRQKSSHYFPLKRMINLERA